jgi:hypothetical protein
LNRFDGLAVVVPILLSRGSDAAFCYGFQGLAIGSWATNWTNAFTRHLQSSVDENDALWASVNCKAQFTAQEQARYELFRGKAQCNACHRDGGPGEDHWSPISPRAISELPPIRGLLVFPWSDQIPPVSGKRS